MGGAVDRRVGILGGVFDPIHLGHLAAAESARRALDLETLVLTPSGAPPHRATPPVASPFHRFAMTALAAGARPGYRASDIELGRTEPSYTARTLDRLRAEGFEATALYFIVGADAFGRITTWYDYPAVLDRAHFVVVPRPGHAAFASDALPPHVGARAVWLTASHQRVDDSAERAETPRVYFLETQTPTVSSTTIRERLAQGHSIADLVPPEVERHIRVHHLYADPPARPRL